VDTGTTFLNSHELRDLKGWVQAHTYVAIVCLIEISICVRAKQ